MNPLDPEALTAIRQAKANGLSEVKLARAITITRPTLRRALAGLPVHPWTALLVGQWLAVTASSRRQHVA